MKKLLFCLLVCAQGSIFGQLQINEVCVRNHNDLNDLEGKSHAFVELYNLSNAEIDIHKYYLSDSLGDLRKWRLPEMLVEQDKRFCIHLSNLNKDSIISDLHANFKLKIGETLYLSERSGPNVFLIDSIQISQAYYGIAQCKFPENSGNIQFCLPSPNLENTLGSSYYPVIDGLNISNGVHVVGTPFLFLSENDVKFTSDGSDVKFESGNGNATNFTLDPYASALKFSMIPTNPSTNFPLGAYSESRANDRGWLPPSGFLPKVQIIRAKAFTSEGIPSEEIIRTIFPSAPSFGLPIISIITDSIGFFDDETGIYVYGNSELGNYTQRGRAWERLARIQFFDSLANFVMESSVGCRIKGNGSRHAAYKSLQFTQRKVFPGDPINDSLFYTSLSLFRNAGHRPDCISRDHLVQKMCQGMSFSYINVKSHILFLNGEFWGLSSVSGDLNEDLFSHYFKIPRNTFSITDHTYTVVTGTPADINEFSELTLFAENNELSLIENYEFVATKLDLNQFIDVNCTQIFFGNGDYPRTNTAWFQVQNEWRKSKWYNLLFDLDGGFGGDCDTILKKFNTLDYILQTSSGNWIKSTRLLRSLLENDNFKNEFSNRMADLMNSTFSANKTIPVFQNYQNEIDNVRQIQVNRWGYPSDVDLLVDRLIEPRTLVRWNEYDVAMLDYFKDRNRYVYRHFMQRFGFIDTARITINVNDIVGGYVQLNSLFLSNELDGVNANVYPWNGLYFKNNSMRLIPFAKKNYRFDSWSNGSTLLELNDSIQSDTLITANFIFEPAYQFPHINELLLTNYESVWDDLVQLEAWVEIFNPNNFSISLDGFFLTNDLNDKMKFPLKAIKEHAILANDYGLFFASSNPNRGKNHLNFSLEANSTNFHLIDTDGNTVLQSITLPTLSPDFSYGSSPNGSSNFVIFDSPTPLASNDLSQIEEITKQKLSFFPNPSSGVIQFSELGNYTVLDMRGVCVWSAKNCQTANLSSLSPGIYIIQNESGKSGLFSKTNE